MKLRKASGVEARRHAGTRSDGGPPKPRGVRTWAILLLAAAATGHAQDHEGHRHHRPSPAASADAVTAGALSIPDVEVTTEDGEQVSFYTDLVQGKVVAINFIFTTCTTICPPMGAIFSRLQGSLGERAGRDVHLISVSVDPVTDTPERLRSWGERFEAGPGWTLVTGSKPEIDRLLKSLQVFTPDYADHSPTVLVGDEAAGRWRRIYGLAPPGKLLEAVSTLGDPEPEEEP